MKKIDMACIIDDDPIYIFGIKKVMKLADFCEDFIVFSNGKEALDNLTSIVESGKKLPEIILLDLNMPIMDGWEFLNAFAKIKTDQTTLIYVCSSSVDPEDIKKAESYGNITNFIVKPVAVKDLQIILENS